MRDEDRSSVPPRRPWPRSRNRHRRVDRRGLRHHPAGHAGRRQAAGRTIRVVAAENFWGSIASQLGGDHVTVTSIITNPDTDPHDYEPTAGRRPHDRRRAVRRSSTASATTRGRPSCSPPTPTPSRTVLDVGDAGRRQGRRQPAPLVLAGRRAPGDRPDHRRLQASSTRPTPPTSTQQQDSLRDHGARPVQPADRRRSRQQVRGHAGRRVGEHLRPAGRGAWA